MNILKDAYRKCRKIYHRLKFLSTVNWIKTLYFNFKMFPFEIAKKLPVYFYGRMKLHDISGNFVINAPIKSGMIGFGQRFELISRSQGISEFYLQGSVTFSGHAHFGQDCLIYIGKNATCHFGHMFGLGSRGKILCYKDVRFGNYVRVGFESQIMDSNFHTLIDLNTGNKLAKESYVRIGDYNWIGNRSSIMQKTITPNHCIIASNSLVNSDFTSSGKNIVVGGVPANLLRTNIARDWDGEKEDMHRWLIV